MRYYGILDGEDDVWGVRIPDVPGCHGGGETPTEAMADAVSALRVVAQLMIEAGEDLPQPRDPAQLRNAPDAVFDAAAGEVFVALPLLVDSGRPARANISLDRSLLEEIDRAARERGLTRSAFLASAAREKIIAGV